VIRKIKKWLLTHERVYVFVIGVLNFFGRNSRIKGKHPTVWLKRTRVFDKGKGNKIIIGKNSVLKNCVFSISGNNNSILIGDNCYLIDLIVWMEDDDNSIELGSRTTVYGVTKLGSIEGCRIRIGEDCMFSSNISFRTGDSHSVLDLEGNRINPGKDIIIGDHVWIGQNVFVGKGASVADHSIVGACAVVTKSFDKQNVALGGNPARIIKENIDWSRKRL